MICLTSMLSGQTINVPDDYASITEAIENAAPGDTILVDQGIYSENINFLGKNIVLASNYIHSLNLADIENTIIDGSSPASPDIASCVIFSSGESRSAVLQGFTITGGTGTDWIDPQFTAYTWHSGGGIFIFQSSPTIRDNNVINNHVDDDSGVSGASGGGICMYGGNPLIINNKIRNNTAKYGAGVVIDYTGCVIKNNIISNNRGGQSYGGAGFWAIGNGSDPVIIENNTIVYNECVGNGRGGAFYLWSTELTARNNIIWGNTQNSGGPVYTRDGAVAHISYTNIEGNYPGDGNIDVSPEFENPFFILNSESPCIDAGNPDLIYNDIEDPLSTGFALWPSGGSLINDMGVFGGPCCLIHENISTGLDEKSLNNNYNNIQFQCYPNPFRDFTRINYSITNQSKIEIVIINSFGRVVKTLISEHKQAGNYNICWDGSDCSSAKVPAGIYICFVRVNNQAVKLHRLLMLE